MDNFLTLQELISEASKHIGVDGTGTLLYYNASKIRDLEAKGDVDKINTVYAFYKELMPDGLYSEFVNSSFGGLTYNDDYAAQNYGEDYFPIPKLCPTADHYVYACVFKNGTIVWENTDPPAGAGGESE